VILSRVVPLEDEIAHLQPERQVIASRSERVLWGVAAALLILGFNGADRWWAAAIAGVVVFSLSELFAWIWRGHGAIENPDTFWRDWSWKKRLAYTAAAVAGALAAVLGF
jgi:hypothetical protein